jgi:hypothetical protein
MRRSCSEFESMAACEVEVCCRTMWAEGQCDFVNEGQVLIKGYPLSGDNSTRQVTGLSVDSNLPVQRKIVY